MSNDNGQRSPLLRVITGEATDEEVAAVLAVVLARSGEKAEAEPTETSTWADHSSRHRRVRGGFTPGRDGWRTSYWPH